MDCVDSDLEDFFNFLYRPRRSINSSRGRLYREGGVAGVTAPGR
jgi:hypothetical protein